MVLKDNHNSAEEMASLVLHGEQEEGGVIFNVTPLLEKAVPDAKLEKME